MIIIHVPLLGTYIATEKEDNYLTITIQKFKFETMLLSTVEK